MLDLEDIQVDTSYQRPVKGGHKKIMADFNEDALGIPLVGEREDGTLWVVDGQQRLTALKKLNKKTVRAEVFNSKGPEHEAEIFKLVNLNRTKLTPGEMFKARLTSGDALAWSIKEVVEACGHVIATSSSGGGNSKYNTSKYVAGVNTLLHMATTKGQGIEAIRFALKTVGAAWPEDRFGVNNNVLAALGNFYSKQKGEVDSERLVSRLQLTNPVKLLYKASSMSTGNNKVHDLVDLIEEAYRKRRGKSQS